ncbi:MAG: hypothetical protein K0S53_588 [Bacteroidetes bacterium]|jgi:hypothetical protein|nr:hypothetical protein [Bacteroidota bacterium]MDF2451353.1 hypothetical protein [Bacteroidota bacterium]
MKQIIFILFFVIGLSGNAQPPLKFHCRYGGSGYDVGYDVKQTLDKGYIITGSTNSFGQGNTDVYLLKLDSIGHVKFQTSFGGFSNDIGKSIIALPDSGFIMVGYTSSTGIGGYDIFLVKADKNGALEWQKTIGGGDWDFAHSMQQTSDGGFIIAGTTYSFGHGNADGYIVKTDATGNVQWSKTYGGRKDDEFKSVTQLTNGSYALAGYTKSYADSLGDAWIFRIDALGDSIASYHHNYGLFQFDVYNDLKELTSGDLILGGAITYTTNLKQQSNFVKVNSVGQVTLQFIDGQVGTDEQFFKVDISNSIFGTFTALQNSHENGSSFKKDVKLLLLSNAGFYVNGGAIGSSQDDECFSFALTNESSKGYIGVGYTNSYNSLLSDVFIIKYDSLLSIGPNIVGMKEEKSQSELIEVYPNPFSDKILFNTNQFNEVFSIAIYNVQGEKIFEKDIRTNKGVIDLNFLENGVYFIQFIDNLNIKYSQKIIKTSY